MIYYVLYILYFIILEIGSQDNMASKIKTDISLSNQSRLSIPIGDYISLKEQIQKVKYPIYAISQAESLTNKIGTFKNENVINKLSEKLKHLNSYRKVRGDGNCFFRALAFSYLCYIPNPTFNNCFQLINQVNLACCYPNSIPKDFQPFYDHKLLTNILSSSWEQIYRKCSQSSQNIRKKTLLKLFDQYPYLDFIIILYFRSVCLKALYMYQQEFQNFLTGDEQKIIRTYSQQSQGIILHLSSKIFRIPIHVYEVRKQQVHSYHYQESTNSKDFQGIYLLFSESHYDIIEYNENIQAQRSVLKKKSTYYDQVNERMRQGVCSQCKVTNWVYQVSNLCAICHENSLAILHNYRKQSFVKGKCNQCNQHTQISGNFGLCKRCIQFQNNRQFGNNNHFIRKKCSLCQKYMMLDPQIGLCKPCFEDQMQMMNYMQQSRKTQTNPTGSKSYFDPRQSQSQNIPRGNVASQIGPGYNGYICKNCKNMSMKGLFNGLCNNCSRQ